MTQGKRPKNAKDWEEKYQNNELPLEIHGPDLQLCSQIEALGSIPKGVLEIGCGTGEMVVWLARHGAEAMGVDISPKAIESARHKAEQAGVKATFQATNFMETNLNTNPKDLVLDRGCFHVFDTLEQRRIFASKVRGLLNPAGNWISLIGSTDGPDRDTGPPRLSLSEVAHAIEPYFEVMSVKAAYMQTTNPHPPKVWLCRFHVRGKKDYSM